MTVDWPDKSSMNDIIISEETTRLQTLEQPLSMTALTAHLNENNHDYITVKTKDRVKNIFSLLAFLTIGYFSYYFGLVSDMFFW